MDCLVLRVMEKEVTAQDGVQLSAVLTDGLDERSSVLDGREQRAGVCSRACCACSLPIHDRTLNYLNRLFPHLFVIAALEL